MFLLVITFSYVKHVCLRPFLAQTEGHQASLLAGRTVVWSPWELGLITQTDIMMDVWWTEQVQQPPAVEKLIFRQCWFVPAACLSSSLPSSLLWCTNACMHMCLYLCISLYTCAITPLQACLRIRQLPSWTLGRKICLVQVNQYNSFEPSSLPPGKMDREWLRGSCWWSGWWQALLHHGQINILSIIAACMC